MTLLWCHLAPFLNCELLWKWHVILFGLHHTLKSAMQWNTFLHGCQWCSCVIRWPGHTSIPDSCIYICSGCKHPQWEEKRQTVSLNNANLSSLLKSRRARGEDNECVVVLGYNQALYCWNSMWLKTRFISVVLYTSILSLLKTHRRQEAHLKPLAASPRQFDFPWMVSCQSVQFKSSFSYHFLFKLEKTVF